MDISRIDDFLYLKSKKALDSFFDYLEPAFDIVKTQELLLFSESEKELLRNYNKENILYQINSSSLIMELFLVVELFIKTELFKSNECFLYRFIDKYPEEKKKERESQEKRNSELEQLKTKIISSLKKRNEERTKKLTNEFVDSFIDIKSSNEFISVSVNEALSRLINYLNWDISEKYLRMLNNLIYCRNEIIHFGKFDHLTIGVSSAINVIQSLVLSAREKNQISFYKNFSKISDEYVKQTNYCNEIFRHIYINEYWNKILENSKDAFEKI